MKHINSKKREVCKKQYDKRDFDRYLYDSINDSIHYIFVHFFKNLFVSPETFANNSFSIFLTSTDSPTATFNFFAFGRKYRLPSKSYHNRVFIEFIYPVIL